MVVVGAGVISAEGSLVGTEVVVLLGGDVVVSAVGAAVVD